MEGTTGACYNNFFARSWKQYRIGEQASESSAKPGAIDITAMLPDNICLNICHLVLDGSSQWVAGRNLTSRGNSLQIDMEMR